VARFESSSNRDGISDARWIDNRHISFIGEGPGEAPQVYILDVQTRRQKKLTSDLQGVVAYDISRDQKKAVYYANWGGDEAETKYKEDHGFAVSDELLSDLVNGNWRHPTLVYQIYIRNLATGTVRAVHAIPFQFFPIRLHIWLSPDGRYAITEQAPFNVLSAWESYDDRYVKRLAGAAQAKTSNYRPLGLTELMLVNIETAEITPLVHAPSSVGSSVVNVIWSSDSNSAILSAIFLPLDGSDPGELARRRAHPVIAEVSVPPGSVRRIIDVPTDVWLTMKPGSSPDTFLINGFKMEGGDFTEALANRHFLRHGDGWIEDKSFVEDDPGSNIQVKQTLNHWPMLVVIDHVTNQEKVIFDPNPQLNSYRFAKEEVIHWKGKRGESQMGGLYYPADYTPGSRYPLVIQTHGFSPDFFFPDGPYTTAFAAQALANKGIAVLQLGGGPLYAASKQTIDLGPVRLSQLESAIDYLDEMGLIDRSRVGLVGFSVTGFQVIYALAHSKYHFAVATSAEGNDQGYWTYVLRGNSPVGHAQDEAPYGGPPWNGNWQIWMKDSISFNYDKVQTPLRLESESNDSGEVIWAWEPFVALRRLNKPVELLYVAHGEHPVVKPWDRIASQQGNVDWLSYWLKGEEDPDPAKADQYARWHELKKLQDAQDTKPSIR
jgi:dipeptidyl aminopeptidase/acylaminoacyl peptidase